jgi:hypothetical protein
MTVQYGDMSMPEAERSAWRMALGLGGGPGVRLRGRPAQYRRRERSGGERRAGRRTVMSRAKRRQGSWVRGGGPRGKGVVGRRRRGGGGWLCREGAGCGCTLLGGGLAAWCWCFFSSSFCDVVCLFLMKTEVGLVLMMMMLTSFN